jgi:hypothetical protein
MGLQEIVVTLNTLGIEYAVLETGGEGAALVLPESGRVLGLWPHWRGENALWVNPGFLDQLRVGVKEDGWPNPGGDRIWLGPEEEFFPEGEGVPPAIDPGRYARTGDKGCCVLENAGEALGWKSGTRARFRVERRIRALGEAELEAAWGAPSLRPAGIEETVTCEVSGNRSFPVWLWNVTQVPDGAEVRVPLRLYWGDTALAELPAGTVALEDNCAVVGLHGGRPLRVRARPAEVASRIICRVDLEAGRSQLLVKDFARDGADERGPGFIECRWGGPRGHGEFSCWSPAAPPGGRQRIRWKTSLCAFSGRRETVRELAARLAAP